MTVPDPNVPDFVKKYVTWGAGPRAGQNLILAAKARALLRGRTYVATEDVKAVAPCGRVVLLGTVAGREVELPLGLLLARRATLIGTVLRSRPLEEKVLLARAFEREVLPLFEAGRLRPVVDEVLPVARIREAHERMERNETFGKIVVAMR